MFQIERDVEEQDDSVLPFHAISKRQVQTMDQKTRLFHGIIKASEK